MKKSHWNNLTNAERKAIYRRDGWQCALCSSTQYLQIHHIEPRGKHGTNVPQNLITLCSTCHGEAHGVKRDGGFDEAEVYQACIEYIADLYADDYFSEAPNMTAYEDWKP